jgi:hypothetical protein
LPRVASTSWWVASSSAFQLIRFNIGYWGAMLSVRKVSLIASRLGESSAGFWWPRSKPEWSHADGSGEGFQALSARKSFSRTTPFGSNRMSAADRT